MQSSTGAVASINRRRDPRQNVRHNATLVLRNGKSTMHCFVCDLSAGGARLKVMGWRLLPETFELRIDGGGTHRVVICSRRAGVIGVRFVDDAET